MHDLKTDSNPSIERRQWLSIDPDDDDGKVVRLDD